MSHPEFDQTKLLALLGDVQDGNLEDSGREALNALLRTSPAACRFFSEHMELHAQLHLDYTSGEVTQFLPGSTSAGKVTRFLNLWLTGLAVAACIALAASMFWPRQAEAPRGFATLVDSRAARWDGSDLPTSDGTRLSKGTLRLAEGLVTLRFDSGAKVSLEAPAELTLVDDMNCILGSGIVLADVPESAIGFRIATSTANVIDYGTRFTVNVDPAAGRTQTHVHEGLVEVEHPPTGAVVALRAGQMNSADKNSMGEARPWSAESSQAGKVGPAMRGEEWTNLTSYKDAYIGDATDKGVPVPRAETLLLVKKSKNGYSDRKSYLGFDLSGIGRDIEDAELTLHFAPTGLGLASDVPDATFKVYGLLVDSPWNDRMIRAGRAPAAGIHTILNMDKVREVGEFVVKQGVQQGRFSIQGEPLAEFLRENSGSKITLIVARDTVETTSTGLVHGFASRRHPTLPPPTLAIRRAAKEK